MPRTSRGWNLSVTVCRIDAHGDTEAFCGYTYDRIMLKVAIDMKSI